MNARWRRYLRFWGPDVDADVDEELQFHLEMRVRDYERHGLDPQDARFAAHARFGSYETVSDALRDHDHAQTRTRVRRDLMDDLLQDIRYAMRSLRRAPAFALVAILTLALGIGANTAMFSIVDSVVLRPLPYPHPEQLASVYGNTLAELTRVGELSRSYAAVGGYHVTTLGLSGDGEPERVAASLASANLFSLLGAGPALGRTFESDENTPGRSNVVVLSDGLWRRRFAADRGVVGRTIMIEGAPFTVIGVMPSGFGFPTADTRLWLPYTLPQSRSGDFWGSGGYQVIARLRPNITAAAAQRELRVLYSEIRHENPLWDPGPTYGADATVTPLQQRLVGSSRTLLFLLLGVVGVVLLISCANVANLLLVRGASRRKEVAIRMAIGGGRGRIIRQLLTESVVLAVLGGVAGVALAWWGVRALTAVLPADIPHVATLGIDMRVLAFTTALVILTAFAFGLLPALRVSASSTQRALGDGARTAGGAHRRVASLLVGSEIAAAVLLTTGAMLLVRSMSALHAIDPGFRTAALVTAKLDPPATKFTDKTSLVPFLESVLSRVRALPGVESVAAVDKLPLTRGVGGLAVRIAGQIEDLHKSLPMSDQYLIVTPDYLPTMSIPLVSGRGFSADDGERAPPVAIVSQSFAEHFWPAGSAVGQRIGYPWPSDWVTIVGVVRDAKLDSLTGHAEQTIYRPFAQVPTSSISLVVRTTSDPAAVAVSLRSAVAQVDASTPVSDVEEMSSLVDRSASRQRFSTQLFALFAGVALLLGIVGVYGVMSYAVAQRTREIGVRLALGASPADAMRMVLREGLTLALGGIAVGVLVALVSTRALAGLLYGVTTTDPTTFVVVPLLLAAAALLASYLPARRATRVDPTTALRAE